MSDEMLKLADWLKQRHDDFATCPASNDPVIKQFCEKLGLWERMVRAAASAEPVAWRYQSKQGWEGIWHVTNVDPSSPGFFETPQNWNVEPLYTHPAPDAEIVKALETIATAEPHPDKSVLLVQFTTAIKLATETLALPDEQQKVVP